MEHGRRAPRRRPPAACRGGPRRRSASTACRSTPGGSTPVPRARRPATGQPSRSKPARRDHDHVGIGRVHVVPRHPHRVRAGSAEQRLAAGAGRSSRGSSAPGEGWVGPLQEHHPRPGQSGHRARDDVQPDRWSATSASAAATRPVARPSATIESSTSSSVCGSMVTTSRGAAQVGQRVVDDGDVDRADRAEVLGDDQVRVEPRECALVEVVEVLAARQRDRPRRRRSRPAPAPRASPTSTRSCATAPGRGSRTRR